MAATDYRFVTHWTIDASPEEISDILSDPLELPRWWPSVYLAVEEISESTYRLHTRGWLPYTLDWQFRVTESNPPYGFSLVATGDFEGTGVWRFSRHSRNTEVVFEWTISARKPLLRWFSFLLKPVFSANHRWAMAQGEKSLRAELARRRGGRLAQGF